MVLCVGCKYRIYGSKFAIRGMRFCERCCEIYIDRLYVDCEDHNCECEYCTRDQDFGTEFINS